MIPVGAQFSREHLELLDRLKVLDYWLFVMDLCYALPAFDGHLIKMKKTHFYHCGQTKSKKHYYRDPSHPSKVM